MIYFVQEMSELQEETNEQNEQNNEREIHKRSGNKRKRPKLVVEINSTEEKTPREDDKPKRDDFFHVSREVFTFY